MILENEDEVLERLESPDNLINRLEIHRLHGLQGRRSGDFPVPPMMQEIIAEIAATDGPKKAAEAFGISQMTASNYGRGLVGPRLDENLKNIVDEAKDKKKRLTEETKDKAHDAALTSLLSSLRIVDDTLKTEEGAKVSRKDLKNAKIASSIATDLSRVHSNLRGKEQETNLDNSKIIIYAPQQRNINNYETVHLREEKAS